MDKWSVDIPVGYSVRCGVGVRFGVVVGVGVGLGLGLGLLILTVAVAAVTVAVVHITVRKNPNRSSCSIFLNKRICMSENCFYFVLHPIYVSFAKLKK